MQFHLFETNKVPSYSNFLSFGVSEWKPKMSFICHRMDERKTYLPSYLNESISAAYLPLVMIRLWNLSYIPQWCLWGPHTHTHTHTVTLLMHFISFSWRVLFFAYRCYVLGGILPHWSVYPCLYWIICSPGGERMYPLSTVINGTLTIDMPKYFIITHIHAWLISMLPNVLFQWKLQLAKWKGFRAFFLSDK